MRTAVFPTPWNPKSQLIGVQLGRALRLRRTGVSIARIPPGEGIVCVMKRNKPLGRVPILRAVGVEFGYQPGHRGTRPAL